MAKKIKRPNTVFMDDFDVAVYLSLARDTLKEALKDEEESELHVNIIHALDKAIYKYRRELWETMMENLNDYGEMLRGEK